MKKNNNKGFTLMEMLIVVAIIAILIAIAIPTFSGALEKSKEAVDMANLRAAYAQVVSDAALEAKKAPAETANVKYTYVTEGTKSYSATVTATQSKKDAWEGETPVIGGMSVNAAGTWTISYNSDGTVSIT